MGTENLETAKNLYSQGKIAFENGEYQQSVDNLEKATSLLSQNSRFAGEVNIWLVNAYEATGRSQEAIALCQQLSHHPHYEVKSQAKRLVYILKAPKLKRPKEWMTEIPDFATISERQTKTLIAAKPQKSTSPQKSPDSEYMDLGQVNTQDNLFIWVALIIAGCTISYLVWLSF
ncbi:hypothetical protein NIES932_20130 [Raphidiopsis curvata NIES-932]|nr:hypothetical protein NIES932_20130 [Raphidiopsis curvata NIES-932]